MIVSVPKTENQFISSGLPVQKFLTASGDGLGAYNLNGNYAAAATDFYYQTTSKYDICSLLIVISDNATFNQIDYGAIVGGVTNGVKLFVRQSGSTVDIPLLGGIPVKKNFEWLSLTHDIILTQFSGTPQTLIVNFPLVYDYGMPITLNNGDSFRIRLNDDFTGLVSHTFGIRGIKY